MEAGRERDRPQWIVREITWNRVKVDRTGDGRTREIPVSLMPDDLAVGDAFQVVAQTEGRTLGPVPPVRRHIRWRIRVKR